MGQPSPERKPGSGHLSPQDFPVRALPFCHKAAVDDALNYPVHSPPLFIVALGEKLPQLPMLINHGNYGAKLSKSGLL